MQISRTKFRATTHERGSLIRARAVEDVGVKGLHRIWEILDRDGECTWIGHTEWPKEISKSKGFYLFPT